MAALGGQPFRVVLTGSESTGKSELARALAAHYGATCAPEYVRDYLDGKGSALDAGDVEPIARGQIERQDAAARTATVLVICDTDLLSTLVYARHYYGSAPSWIEEKARTQRADLYLLMDIDAPWVADPQRDRGDRRQEMHALFRHALEQIGARYVTISGNWEERRARAVAAIDDLLRRTPGKDRG